MDDYSSHDEDFQLLDPMRMMVLPFAGWCERQGPANESITPDETLSIQLVTFPPAWDLHVPLMERRHERVDPALTTPGMGRPSDHAHPPLPLPEPPLQERFVVFAAAHQPRGSAK